MRPIVNPPVTEVLTPMPIIPTAGCCVVGDPISVDQNLYFLFPGTTAALTQFWRYDTASNTWHRRADPIAVAGTNVIGVATTMTYDVSRGVIWLFHADSAAPFAQLRSYTIATDTWALMAQAGGTIQAAGLAAQFSLGAAMVHPCTGVLPGLAVPVAPLTLPDNYLYIVGHNVTTIFRYAIAVDGAVPADSFAALAGGGGARGGAANTGCTFDWLPGINENWLIGIRGGGSAAADRYVMATDTWAAASPTTYATFGSGTSAVSDIARNRIVVQPDGYSAYWDGTELYDYAPAAGAGSLVWKQVATMYGGNGTPHNGRSIVALATAGEKWIYVRSHTSSAFQRIQLIE